MIGIRRLDLGKRRHPKMEASYREQRGRESNSSLLSFPQKTVSGPVKSFLILKVF